MTSAEIVARNKAIVKKFHDEVIVGMNYDLVPQLMHDEMEHARGAIGETLTQIDPAGVAKLRGLKGHARFIAATKLLRSHFPQWNSRMLEIVGDGDLVVTHCVVDGKDSGGFLGAGPKGGATFSLDQLVMHKVVDGKIKRIFALSDQLGFWRALGAPLPGGADQISQKR
jgi:predicted ester cyclase